MEHMTSLYLCIYTQSWGSCRYKQLPLTGGIAAQYYQPSHMTQCLPPWLQKSAHPGSESAQGRRRGGFHVRVLGGTLKTKTVMQEIYLIVNIEL